VTPGQIVAIAVRLFAVWLTLFVIVNAYPVSLLLGKTDVLAAILFCTIATLVSAAISLALWCFPQTVAKRLLSEPITEAAALPGSADSWLATGCALIGIWLIASSLPSLTRYVVGFTFFAPGDVSSEAVQLSIYYSVRIAIGAWLLFGARGLRKLYWWAQHAGVSTPEE
jgi:hypothetical protein